MQPLCLANRSPVCRQDLASKLREAEETQSSLQAECDQYRTILAETVGCERHSLRQGAGLASLGVLLGESSHSLQSVGRPVAPGERALGLDAGSVCPWASPCPSLGPKGMKEVLRPSPASEQGRGPGRRFGAGGAETVMTHTSLGKEEGSIQQVAGLKPLCDFRGHLGPALLSDPVLDLRSAGGKPSRVESPDGVLQVTDLILLHGPHIAFVRTLARDLRSRTVATFLSV